ncbi:MAG TPA: DUF4124 domain-containing protein [Myxococcaceae bacterium]|nr:DUF4124 domain-containing protein [Myxococcaceae bacterium]
MRYFILLSMCFYGLPAALAEPIYRWVDDQGVPNYTNDRSKVPAQVKAEVTDGDEITVIATAREPSRTGAGTTSPEAAPPIISTYDERDVANAWRAAFHDAHARVAWMEFEVKNDKQLLEDGGMQITRVSGQPLNNLWAYQPGYLLLQDKLHRDLMELKQAREDLEALERDASREAIPREWRQP